MSVRVCQEGTFQKNLHLALHIYTLTVTTLHTAVFLLHVYWKRIHNRSIVLTMLEVPSSAGAALEEQVQRDESILLTDPNLLSRLLYPNPVCLLTTTVPKRNVMTISWLTPTDNAGHFFMSVNRRRFTAENLQTSPYFVLNVPVGGMEGTIRGIGSCSGREVDKFDTLKIDTCAPGWEPSSEAPLPKKLRSRITDIPAQIAIVNCVAHLLCKANQIRIQDDVHESSTSGHYAVFAEILYAFVRKDYWDGVTFIGRSADQSPLLSFLGSGKFGYIKRPGS